MVRQIRKVDWVKYTIVMEIHLKPELEEAHKRAEIAAKIDEGYAAAQRGELIDADAVVPGSLS